jgi:DNA mismatch repair protein MutS
MAGMPPSLISRANEILRHLESLHEQDKAGTTEKMKTIKTPGTGQVQLSIFDAHTETFDEIRKLLERTDINRLTPVEALLKLQEIKEKLK